jgi:hypothetical protein
MYCTVDSKLPACKAEKEHTTKWSYSSVVFALMNFKKIAYLKDKESETDRVTF